MNMVHNLSVTAFAVILATGPVAGSLQQAAAGPASPAADAIKAKMKTLRSLPDAQRWETTRDLSGQIAQLPPGEQKVGLAEGLAGLSTEGNAGAATWQPVADTLSTALAEHPMTAGKDGKPNYAYAELATLVTFYGVHTSLHAAPYEQSLKTLKKNEDAIRKPDFTLEGLNTQKLGLPASIRLHDLRGKFVIVNFWATWCPPCRKEMPDFQALTQQYGEDKLVVLGISNEDPQKVTAFLDRNHYSYPILLDPWHKAEKQFSVEGIPQTFLYDKNGTLLAHWVDQVSKEQIEAKLHAAGLS